MKEINSVNDAYGEFVKETGDFGLDCETFDSVFQSHFEMTEYNWERFRKRGTRKATYKTILNSVLTDMVGWYRDAMGYAELVDFSNPKWIANHHKAYIYVYALVAKRKGKT